MTVTYVALNVTDLRPCPFCVNSTLRIVRTGTGTERVMRVMCPECGCLGPQCDETDPDGQAQFKWNQRFDRPN